MSQANLFEQQARNRKRSRILVALFLLFFAWIGFGGDLAFYLYTVDAKPGQYQHTVPWFGILAVSGGAWLTWFAWRRGPKSVLWSTGAWELVEPGSHEEKMLVNVVEEMAIASGLPKPKIWLVSDQDPNAFATGVEESEAHVAVTEGLLKSLNRDELQSVVAHEMAHIRNHDVKLMTLLAALVGIMGIVSDGAWRFMGFGGRASGRSRGKGGGNALAAVVFVLWIVSVLLAPLLSRMLALAVSRKREYLADATAAQFTRNPAALASALDKIESAANPTKAIKRGSAHLCIADPLGRRLTHKEGFVATLLATHPPMAVRIARLKAMAFQYEKTGVIPDLD